MANQPGQTKPTYRKGGPLKASDLQQTNSAIPKNIIGGGGSSVRSFGENLIVQPSRAREPRDWNKRFRLINDYGADIPPFAVCEITATDYSETVGIIKDIGNVPVYVVTRPTTNSLKAYVFAGPAGISELDPDAESDGDQRGKCWGTLDFYQGGIPAVYEGAIPTIDDEVGTIAGSFNVSTSSTGMIVLGVDTEAGLCFLRPGSSGGGGGVTLDIVQVIETPGIGVNSGTIGVKNAVLKSDLTEVPNFIQSGDRRVVAFYVFS